MQACATFGVPMQGTIADCAGCQLQKNWTLMGGCSCLHVVHFKSKYKPFGCHSVSALNCLFFCLFTVDPLLYTLTDEGPTMSVPVPPHVSDIDPQTHPLLVNKYGVKKYGVDKGVLDAMKELQIDEWGRDSALCYMKVRNNTAPEPSIPVSREILKLLGVGNSG